MIRQKQWGVPAMPAGPLPSAATPPPTLAEAVLAQRGVHRPGLVGDGFAYTEDAVLLAACARAALLGELPAAAVHPHVGLLLENTPEYVHWLQACALAGATAVGVNPTRRGSDLYRDIQHTDCAVLVTENRLLPLLAGADLPQRRLVVDRPGYAGSGWTARTWRWPTSRPSWRAGNRPARSRCTRSPTRSPGTRRWRRWNPDAAARPGAGWPLREARPL